MTASEALAVLAEIIAAEIPEVEDPTDVAFLILAALRAAGYELVPIKSARGLP
jgi:hypothetical protein